MVKTPYSSGKKRTLTISSFWMDQTEITNDEYRQFVHWVRDSIIRTEIYENYASEAIDDDNAAEVAFIMVFIDLSLIGKI